MQLETTRPCLKCYSVQTSLQNTDTAHGSGRSECFYLYLVSPPLPPPSSMTGWLQFFSREKRAKKRVLPPQWGWSRGWNCPAVSGSLARWCGMYSICSSALLSRGGCWPSRSARPEPSTPQCWWSLWSSSLSAANQITHISFSIKRMFSTSVPTKNTNKTQGPHNLPPFPKESIGYCDISKMFGRY